MNRFKFLALAEEFEFLNDLVNEDELESLDAVQVKRFDENLLKFVPTWDEVDGSLVAIDQGEKVHFVCGEGMLYNEVKRSHDFSSNYAHTDPYTKEGESILEAIYRLRIEDDLMFIVVEEYGYNIVDHHSQDNRRFTIYKPAKNLKIGDLITSEIKKAEAKVDAEVNF